MPSEPTYSELTNFVIYKENIDKYGQEEAIERKRDMIFNNSYASCTNGTWEVTPNRVIGWKNDNELLVEFKLDKYAHVNVRSSIKR